MSVLENFKNIPRSPSHRATGPKCNFFFFKFATKSLEKKKGGLSPPRWATGACRPPLGRQGAVARWGGDRVPSPFISPGRHTPPFPLSFEPKNSGKKLECLPCCHIFFEMVEEHYYWVTYVWAKNATFGKPVIAVLSSGNL